MTSVSQNESCIDFDYDDMPGRVTTTPEAVVARLRPYRVAAIGAFCQYRRMILDEMDTTTEIPTPQEAPEMTTKRPIPSVEAINRMSRPELRELCREYGIYRTVPSCMAMNTKTLTRAVELALYPELRKLAGAKSKPVADCEAKPDTEETPAPVAVEPKSSPKLELLKPVAYDLALMHRVVRLRAFLDMGAELGGPEFRAGILAREVGGLLDVLEKQFGMEVAT